MKPNIHKHFVGFCSRATQPTDPLQWAGDHYRFIYQLVQEHFAAMPLSH